MHNVHSKLGVKRLYRILGYSIENTNDRTIVCDNDQNDYPIHMHPYIMQLFRSREGLHTYTYSTHAVHAIWTCQVCTVCARYLMPESTNSSSTMVDLRCTLYIVTSYRDVAK